MFTIYIKNPPRRILLWDENCGRLILRCTTLFLMATHVLPASPNFGQAKHGQKGPSATFPPKGVCSPKSTGLFTFYGLSQYLSAFWVKKSPSSHFWTSWRPNRWHQIKKLGFNSSNLLWGRSVASELKPRQVHRLFLGLHRILWIFF